MRYIGRNLADPSNKSILESFQKSASHQKKNCIFLSHITENKTAVIEIGKYIQNAGFDIYLDIYDDELQKAVTNGNSEAITKCIENGINASTDMLCIVSEKTKKSWWVPYEIGYGKRAENSVSTLLLKDVSDIPSYLTIGNLIRGIKSLNIYIASLQKKENDAILLEKSAFPANYILEHSTSSHSLVHYLDWQK